MHKAAKLAAICIALYWAIYLIVWIDTNYTCKLAGAKAETGLTMASYCDFGDHTASAWMFRR